MSIFIAIVFMSVIMPIRFKFDGEKARYANIIVMGAILAVAFGASKLIDYIPGHITESAEKFFAALEDNGIVVLSAVIAVQLFCSRISAAAVLWRRKNSEAALLNQIFISRPLESNGAVIKQE